MEYRYLEFEFDKGRLERSKDVAIIEVDGDGHPLPDYHYAAFGGSPQLHYCHTKPHFSCDCPDFEWGNETRLCKHLIAALVYERDEVFGNIINENRDPLGVRGK